MHEAAGVGIGYYTIDGIVVLYNAVAAKNMNGNKKDFEGKSVFDLFPKPEAELYLKRIKRAAISETPLVYDDQVDLPVGIRWFNSVFSRIVDVNNSVVGIQIISTDIIDRKLAEKQNQKQLEELKRYNSTMVDREIKMIQLKKEINDYCRQLNLPEKYNIPKVK